MAASWRPQMETAAAFAGDATRFGLDQPLPPAEQAQRNRLQAKAHCDALPDTLLPRMVAIQRLRDAELARAALAALQDSGAPVVVITGNGHARADWGVPALIARAKPDVTVATLGQAETGAPLPPGRFDKIETAPQADRGDPCEAFR